MSFKYTSNMLEDTLRFLRKEIQSERWWEAPVRDQRVLAWPAGTSLYSQHSMRLRQEDGQVLAQPK